MEITSIKPRWMHGWANDPDIEITVDTDIYKEWEWIYQKIPRGKSQTEQVMLISTNNAPFVRFLYVDKPDGNPTDYGALGGEYKLDTGEIYKTRTGWSSREGIMNRDYIEYLSHEITGVIVFTPQYPTVGMAGTAMYWPELYNHPKFPRDCYMVRQVKHNNEPYWTISTDPDKVVKPPTVTTDPALDQLDEAWTEYDSNYCAHGYYKGIECPDCDTSSPVAVMDCDPGDCNDYGKVG